MRRSQISLQPSSIIFEILATPILFCVSQHISLILFYFLYQLVWPIATECLTKVSLLRSIPSPANTQTTAYQWPPSPILPPISSRTPHLVPETLMPSGTQLAITNSAHNNPTHNHHHKSAGSWIENDWESSNNDDQFSSDVPPGLSSISGSYNKFTRQREPARASRSLDKYWINCCHVIDTKQKIFNLSQSLLS